MTKFWTILLLTYAADGETLDARLLFPSATECGAAMPAIYEPVRDVYPDSTAQCIQTGLLSASPRPKVRPWTAD
ncbi:MAG TPA: hypothetical protein VIG24_08990 [Acidimicrobiia bacterium]